MAYTQTMKRTAPSGKRNADGWKMVIMVGSLAATLGGWGILATGQTQSAALSNTTTASSANISSAGTQQTFSQFSAPAIQFPSIARTRSSR